MVHKCDCSALFKFIFFTSYLLLFISTTSYEAPPEWMAETSSPASSNNSPSDSSSSSFSSTQRFHVFVINLNASSPRYVRLSRHLTQHGIVFERWPGTDGTALTPEQRSELALPLCAHFCHPKTIGCGTSHLRLWAHLAQSQSQSQSRFSAHWNYSVVLEDDAVVHPHFIHKLNTLVSALEIEESTSSTSSTSSTTTTSPAFTNLMCMAGMLCGVRVARKSQDAALLESITTMSATGYVISHHSAAMLAVMFPRIGWHLDAQLAMAYLGGHVRLFSSSEMLVRQDGSASTISTNLNYPPILRQLSVRVLGVRIYWESPFISYQPWIELNSCILAYLVALLAFPTNLRVIMVLMVVEWVYYVNYRNSWVMEDRREL
eukprot:TRINITY_DN8294_c0_g1_i1.p1 TRINITY_DN8294_c0_g1~~TRINITY_DN8294_c0_g1_i1.p1  ORF type:complete len:375 (-),score=66.02 TRINITY_DN8294_c0_g1_i1:136-1260(-)